MLRRWLLPALSMTFVFCGFSSCHETQQCQGLIEAVRTFQPHHLSAQPQLDPKAFSTAATLLLTSQKLSIPKSVLAAKAPEDQCTDALHLLINDRQMSPPDAALLFLDYYFHQFDPHSRAVPDENLLAGALREDFGLQLERSVEDRILRISDVIVGGPASKRGLTIGQTVLSIDHKDVSELDDDALASVLDSSRKLVVLGIGNERNPGQIIREVTLVRGTYHVQPYDVELTGNGDVAYVRVRALARGESSINFILNTVRHAKALVLDLRDLAGGEIQVAREVADALTTGTLFAGFIDRNLKLSESEPPLEVNSLFDKPIVVLVNSGTKSSAEMLAATLQDYGAIVIGRPTFGKGTSQTLHSLKRFGIDGSLALTSTFVVRPSQKLLQLTGVKPDILLPAAGPERRERDLKRALEPSKANAFMANVKAWDYDSGDFPFRRAEIEEQLEQVETELHRLTGQYALGSTMNEQYIEAAKRVAQYLVDIQGAALSYFGYGDGESSQN